MKGGRASGLTALLAPPAMSDYTITNLAEVDDSAAARGLDFGSARFPREMVGAERTGFAHITLLPGRTSHLAIATGRRRRSTS